MTDDLDPTRLLASAALDNEATADERAQVDASASLTAEMQAYAALRDELAAVDVPPASRESALSAALAVFDAIRNGTDVGDHVAAPVVALAPPSLPPPSNVVSLHARRQRQYRWVGGIAAAAVVAVVGIAVINGPSSSDDKKSSTTAPGPRVAADGSAEKAPAATTVPGLATQAAPAPAAEATIDASASDAGGDGGVGAAPATTAAAAATTAGATETTEAAADTAAFDPWFGAQDFNNVHDLAAYAGSPQSPVALPALESAETTAASTADTEATETTEESTGNPVTTVAATSPPFGSSLPGSPYPCDTGERLVAPILWMGDRALLVRSDDIGEFQVVSAATCAVLVEFPIS